MISGAENFIIFNLLLREKIIDKLDFDDTGIEVQTTVQKIRIEWQMFRTQTRESVNKITLTFQNSIIKRISFMIYIKICFDY